MAKIVDALLSSANYSSRTTLHTDSVSILFCEWFVFS